MTATASNPQSKIQNPKSERLFTFASGGWIILIAFLGCLVVVAWAVTPVIMRKIAGGARAPGDNATIESYQFDLSNLTVPREYIVPAMMHRDMVPTLNQPTHSGPTDAADPAKRWDAMQLKNDPKYGKYLLPADVVVGVALDGEARAYPLHVLNVHEIINDVLGGSPIAVTYNWPCASTVVFDRRVNAPLHGTAVFAHSGLLYNSNLLMYDRNQTRSGSDTPEYGGGNEMLWCQLTGRPISGDASAIKSSLSILPCEVTTWADWSTQHPETTVVDRNLEMYERYKDAAPTQYFNRPDILTPVSPMVDADTMPAKTRVLAVITSEGCRVYPLPYVLSQARPIAESSSDSPADLLEWTDTLGTRTLRFLGDRKAGTVRVECDPPDGSMFSINAFWFAWHAMHPNDALYVPAAGD